MVISQLLPVGQADLAMSRVNGDNLAEQHSCIALLAQQVANRRGDVRPRQRAAGVGHQADHLFPCSYRRVVLPREHLFLFFLN